MDVNCVVWINGEEVRVDPQRKLMDVLRNDFHLKSVKDGCSEGACGTCTVLVDGKSVKACVQKMERMAGKHIVTVGGSQTGRRRHLHTLLGKQERCSADSAFREW